MICHRSLGINAGIILILLIFGVLFSLPLKLLLNTNYGDEFKNESKISVAAATEGEREKSYEISTTASENEFQKLSNDFRSLKMCRNFQYESTLKSVFFNSYDRNCTMHVEKTHDVPVSEDDRKERTKFHKPKSKLQTTDETSSKSVQDSENNARTNNKKSLSIAGHILAVMLIGSALAALVEVLRARFFSPKEERPDGNSSGRRSSLIDFAQRRYVRKETIQAQKSFEIQGLMHRSPLRLIAARPPPLLRRSSFPAQCLMKKDNSAVLTTAAGVQNRLSRRPSFAVADSEEELTDFRRHSRLIRRH